MQNAVAVNGWFGSSAVLFGTKGQTGHEWAKSRRGDFGEFLSKSIREMQRGYETQKNALDSNEKYRECAQG